MGNSSFGGEPHLSKLTTSYSTNSLDIKLLLCANRTQSLLTESVTLDSFCSNAADPLPAFPPSKIPGFSLIGLGDHLKLFSSTILQLKDEPDKSTVMISTPTLPRLKCMLKECLSITKWAKNSTGWQPPSHTPWMNMQTHATHEWIPEGSLFAPDSFSRALLKKRQNKSSEKLSLIASLGDIPDEKYGAAQITHRDSQDIVKADSFRYNIHGLENINPLAPSDSCVDIAYSTNDGLDPKVASRNLSLPSLVVSNSYFTFPIPFESITTHAGGLSDTLARRRGKNGPPRLVEKSKTVFDFPYPDVPAVFPDLFSMGPGSPSKGTDLDTDQKPGLRFEDMIKNLRLQCSTLEPRIPVTDSTTWNSRSPAHVSCSPVTSLEDPTKDKSEHADRRVVVHKSVHLGARSASVPKSLSGKPVSRPRASSVHRPHRLEKLTGTIPEVIEKVQRSNSRITTHFSISTIARSGRTEEKSSTVRTPEEVLRQLRSAMVKPSSTTTRHAFKKVRFAVVEYDPEGELCPDFHEQKERAFDRPEADDAQEKGSRNNSINDTNQKPLLQRAASCAQKPPWKELRRVRSASSNQPRSYSLVVKSTTPISGICTESEIKNVDPRPGPAQSTSSLGRHSLSRIIRGPIFSGRDGRRVNFAMSGHEVDENAVRRENQSLPEAHQKRKSRMPIPLRNILTRFK